MEPRSNGHLQFSFRAFFQWSACIENNRPAKSPSEVCWPLGAVPAGEKLGPSWADDCRKTLAQWVGQTSVHLQSLDDALCEAVLEGNAACIEYADEAMYRDNTMA